MDWVATCQKIREIMKQYRYVVLVLLLGLFLMLMPQTEKSKTAVPATIQEKTSLTLQEELEMLLCQMDGAGRVKVLLTEAEGERTIFQTDDHTEHTEGSGSTRKQTVIVSDSGRGEEGLVRQTLSPVYLGAVILCQGADSASVRLAIIEAVSSATGLATHNIAVLKMK